MMNPAAAPPDWQTDPDELRDYTRRKLALAAQLRALVEVLKKAESTARLRRCEQLMVKLAEDRFTLAVVGQFKRGKSSLMNAIIKRDLLPTGVLPLTSAITVLKFGPTERLVIRRINSPFPETVPVSSLAEYVTEKGNPGNRKRVQTATLEVPLPFLRRGLEFVDTPGVGSAIEANTATTLAFLTECDAVVFVTSVESPFSESELDFLHTIRGHIGKIFFVVNKTDLLRDERERNELLNFVRSEIRAEMEAEQVRLFPVSSLRATGGRSEADPGLSELETALAEFLAKEKSAVFLAAIAEKALRLIDEESSHAQLDRRARDLPVTERQRRVAEVREQWKRLAGERSDLLARFGIKFERQARELADSESNRSFRAAMETGGREIDRLICEAGWRFGEEVAERVRIRMETEFHERATAFTAKLGPQLKQRFDEELRPVREELGSNLSAIVARAASAFEVEAKGNPELPAVQVEPAFDQRLVALAPSRPLHWISFLPARLIREFVKSTLLKDTEQFGEIWRAHADLVAVAAAKRMIEQLANQVETAAAELEARLNSAITGEPLRGFSDGALDTIRAKILTIGEENLSPGAIAGETEETVFSANEQRTPLRSPPIINLTSDLQAAGCAACNHMIKLVFDFLAHWQYAIATEEGAQEQFAAEGGFCPLHMWQLHALSSSTGESTGLARLAEETSSLVRRAKTAEELKERLRDGSNCRLCALVAKSENAFLDRLAQSLGESTMREHYTKSEGLCLRHVVSLLPRIPTEMAQVVLDKAAQQLEEAAEDMQAYAIKRAALRSQLGRRDEEDAHLRALIHLAGGKDVATPWPEDREI